MFLRRNIRGDEKYLWTLHAQMKMRHYRLTESRVKRVIRHPARIEEGILENAIAVMQPADPVRSQPRRDVGAAGAFGRRTSNGAGGKKYSEIWVMYVLLVDAGSSALRFRNTTRPSSDGLAQQEASRSGKAGHHADSPPDGFETAVPRPHQSSRFGGFTGRKKIKIITAWRYPGKSPTRDPIPQTILREVRSILFS